MTDLINPVSDKLAIIQLLNQFGLAIDLRDWDSFRNLFAESVVFDYSSIGEIAGTLKPEEIANTASNDLGGFKTTQHVITNHIVELSGNTATCKAHVRAMHLLPNDDLEPMLEIGGYYIAGLSRTDLSWKIESWKFVILWSKGELKLFDLAKKQPSN